MLYKGYSKSQRTGGLPFLLEPSPPLASELQTFQISFFVLGIWFRRNTSWVEGRSWNKIDLERSQCQKEDMELKELLVYSSNSSNFVLARKQQQERRLKKATRGKMENRCPGGKGKEKQLKQKLGKNGDNIIYDLVK